MTATATTARPADRYARQAAVGLGLAAAVLGGWIALHVLDVFVLPWRVALALSPLLVALQCWLSVGLFIVAHDAMHGSRWLTFAFSHILRACSTTMRPESLSSRQVPA